MVLQEACFAPYSSTWRARCGAHVPQLQLHEPVGQRDCCAQQGVVLAGSKGWQPCIQADHVGLCWSDENCGRPDTSPGAISSNNAKSTSSMVVCGSPMM